MRRWRCWCVLALASTLSACATTEVAAWQKQYLARGSMALDRAPLERGFFQHSYESKEAASGGRGVGGGGCGCN